MSTINEEKEAPIQDSHVLSKWDQVKSFQTKRFKDYVGPTGIWMLTYYLVTIFVMICLNVARVGWSGEAIFAAPAYFAQLFLNYGLNAGKVAADPLDTENDFYIEKIEFGRALTSASWIFAPMIIYILGMLFVFLVGSGYPQPEGAYSYLENFRFFHERTVLLWGDVANDRKGGGFYFILVWIPIIVATLVGAFVSKRVFEDKKQASSFNVIKMMGFNLLSGFIIGYQMAYMTGGVSLSIGGALKTIFTNSYDNFGFYFSGQYNPHSIILTSWFINLIPIFIAALWYIMYNQIEDASIKYTKNTIGWMNSTINRIKAKRSESKN
ncbi:MAG: hypothetical protein ACFFDW_13700 [Candidatus Thorarchaeota archaeon]